VNVQIQMFLTSGLDGGEWLASCPGCCTPRIRAPSMQWIGGWLGPRADVNALMKRIPSLPLLGIKAQSSSL